MKGLILSMVLICFFINISISQNTQAESDNVVIEGSKVIVELLKVIGKDKVSGSNNVNNKSFINFCVTNNTVDQIDVIFKNQNSEEFRELIIQSNGKECNINIPIGVWNYTIKQIKSQLILRKGDILLEKGIDIEMNIK